MDFILIKSLEIAIEFWSKRFVECFNNNDLFGIKECESEHYRLTRLKRTIEYEVK